MHAELLTGDRAPAFLAVSVGGDCPPGSSPVSLETLRGRRVVLSFYPLNDTPGNAAQACAIRDAWDELRAHATIFGVRHDPPDDLRRIVAQLALPFAFLSDPDGRIALAYGVWMGNGGTGDAEGGESIERTTFLLDADGRVEAVLRRADPARHAVWLLEMLRP